MIPYIELDAKKILTALSVEDIDKVYEGAPGCGCGCNGEYSSDEAAKARVLKYAKAHASEAEATVCGPYGGPPVIALENTRRYRWIYLK